MNALDDLAQVISRLPAVRIGAEIGRIARENPQAVDALKELLYISATNGIGLPAAAAARLRQLAVTPEGSQEIREFLTDFNIELFPSE